MFGFTMHENTMDWIRGTRQRAAALAAIGTLITGVLFVLSAGHPIAALLALIGIPLLLYIGVESPRDLLVPPDVRPAEMPMLALAAQLPGVMWTTDRDLVITGTYGSGLANTTITPAAFVGRRLAEIFGDRPEPLLTHQQALAGEAGAYQLVVGDEYFSVRVTPLTAADGTIVGCVGLALNSSERIRAEHELAQANLRLTTLLETARIMLSSADNANSAELLGVVAPACRASAMALLSCDARGECVRLVATSVDATADVPLAITFVDAETADTSDAYIVEQATAALGDLRIDGHHAAAWRVWPIRAGTTLFGAIGAVGATDEMLIKTVADQLALDIQQDRLLEQVREGRERLRTLSQRLVEAQETERRALSIELHDEMGQSLTSLTILLDTLALPPEPALQTRVAEASSIVRDLTDRVRQLSLDLRPGTLDDLGLLPALLWHIDRFHAHTGIRVSMHQRLADRRFPPAVETAAYRIVQEALTNIARHAQTDSADVSLFVDRDVLVVQIEDHGRGFDLAARDGSRSIGLVGMRERALLAGGRLQIVSTPGDGTQILAELPIDGMIERRRDTR